MSTSKREWQEGTYQEAKERSPERDAAFETSSGKPVEPLYTPEDVSDNGGFDYEGKLGYPGAYPYTRGIQPTMYRGRFWTMRQYAGFGTAEESNERYKYLLSQGQTGLSVAFDLPTQIGYDADDSMAASEVGKVGVSICSIRDMETLFDGISLDKVTTSMTINATASILLALYVAVAKRQGADLTKIGGTTQHDILKEYVARGTYIFPPRPSMRLVTDVFQYCRTELPSWNTISISGYHMREAGCTAAQEVGFTMAHAIAYVEAGLETGLVFDEFAPRLAFFFACHGNFLEEIAKFRAARRLWARIAKERFGAKDPRSMMLRFHTQTGGATLTAQQVNNNIVRTTFQALSAVLGGTQSLHTNSKDEALALPTQEAAELALRTQQIIAYESGVGDTVDPVAGSYVIEQLTDQVEAEAQEYIDRIDAIGGALTAIEQGFQQREIQESAFRMQKDIEAKRRVVVGVNEYVEEEEAIGNLMRVNPVVGEHQRKRLEDLRNDRDEARAQQLLEQLGEAAEGTGNLMPHLIECVENSVTLGEICHVLRGLWGEYQGTLAI
ncbi:MAG: methylmalonyl-CoA mutase family protein [Chloroflexi bacterium]|nr:methylmalonyl-CoA mutase family protein [Chloroflexota bacterium]MCH8009874.1 methylmalonyl-CoA mutase family protein [Chloroflexota bacterium]